ncbi:histidine phosphatase family protein [Phanerochaete sordida]|uniref:Histidine phosphatase family protein n=1 Tax=Phanerochaete sordida TaxID=48140 RepID=A0A9P3G3A6_9APHY|nr:histidine phosphatase family protein [Phanerochaete sordida]
MGKVTVYIIRHGETQENREGIMQGQLDTELNAAGIEQAQLTANALENVRFTAAHSSDLRRAVKTAEAILAKHPGVALQTHAALRERHMGSMQGQGVAAWRGDLPGDMESAVAFMQRADQWWKDTIVRCAARAGPGNAGGGAAAEESPGETVLVVSHGGLIHVMLQNLIESRKLQLAEGVHVGRYRFPNASVTVVEVGQDGKGTVLLFADRTHLDVELVEENVDDVGKE